MPADTVSIKSICCSDAGRHCLYPIPMLRQHKLSRMLVDTVKPWPAATKVEARNSRPVLAILYFDSPRLTLVRYQRSRRRTCWPARMIIRGRKAALERRETALEKAKSAMEEAKAIVGGGERWRWRRRRGYRGETRGEGQGGRQDGGECGLAARESC